MPKRRESLNFGARDLPINHFHVSCSVSNRVIVPDSKPRLPSWCVLTPLGDRLKPERVGQGNEATGRDPTGARVIVAGLRSDGAVRYEVANARIRSEDLPADVDHGSVLGVGNGLVRASLVFGLDAHGQMIRADARGPRPDIAGLGVAISPGTVGELDVLVDGAIQPDREVSRQTAP